ncbi:MAG TPA: FAD-binding protein [Bdellovibrionota bacterium]|nr:FAD-binding protein [Bdellovibrionota bacterium]
MSTEKEAIKALAECVSGTRLLHDPAVLERYSRSTAFWSTKPLAVVFPENREEVQNLIKIANRFRVPVYPVSQGRNWGYGDACAPTDCADALPFSYLKKSQFSLTKS